MEPSPAASPTTPTNKPAVPRSYVWGALIVAAALPVVLLGTVIAILAATNYNILNWME